MIWVDRFTQNRTSHKYLFRIDLTLAVPELLWACPSSSTQCLRRRHAETNEQLRQITRKKVGFLRTALQTPTSWTHRLPTLVNACFYVQDDDEYEKCTECLNEKSHFQNPELLHKSVCSMQFPLTVPTKTLILSERPVPSSRLLPFSLRAEKSVAGWKQHLQRDYPSSCPMFTQLFLYAKSNKCCVFQHHDGTCWFKRDYSDFCLFQMVRICW